MPGSRPERRRDRYLRLRQIFNPRAIGIRRAFAPRLASIMRGAAVHSRTSRSPKIISLERVMSRIFLSDFSSGSKGFADSISHGKMTSGRDWVIIY
jgi:hypothetical protein